MVCEPYPRFEPRQTRPQLRLLAGQRFQLHCLVAPQSAPRRAHRHGHPDDDLLGTRPVALSAAKNPRSAVVVGARSRSRGDGTLALTHAARVARVRYFRFAGLDLKSFFSREKIVVPSPRGLQSFTPLMFNVSTEHSRNGELF